MLHAIFVMGFPGTFLEGEISNMENTLSHYFYSGLVSWFLSIARDMKVSQDPIIANKSSIFCLDKGVLLY